MTTTATTIDLKRRADELAAEEVLVATNAGTYGQREACRTVGCGDPRYADREIYVRVGDGQRREVGCDAERAPGRMRQFGRVLAVKQGELASLRALIARATRRKP